MSPPPSPTDPGHPHDRCEDPCGHPPTSTGAPHALDSHPATPPAHAAPDVVLNTIAHTATCTCGARRPSPASSDGEAVDRAWPSRDSEGVCQNWSAVNPVATSTRSMGPGQRQAIEAAGHFRSGQKTAARAPHESHCIPARPPSPRHCTATPAVQLLLQEINGEFRS
ncbi:hypothetical protein C8R47DRAFT_1227858 [Mycena vitilis]|nr:hypothetical protein C8R47DRAFT_1227858 [Mycena vitilis]